MPCKHIAYYEVLEALGASECPVCALVGKSIRRRIEWLFHEGVNDSGIRDKLVASRGFCPRHSELILEIGYPLGVALIYQDVVRAVAADFARKLLSPGKRRAGKQARDCPACDWAESSERQYLEVIAQHFADDEMRTQVLGCPSLCVPHTEKLAEMLPSHDQISLRKAAQSHLSELGSELSEIVRKSEYRCEEPFGLEADAWIRVVSKISGCGRVR